MNIQIIMTPLLRICKWKYPLFIWKNWRLANAFPRPHSNDWWSRLCLRRLGPNAHILVHTVSPEFSNPHDRRRPHNYFKQLWRLTWEKHKSSHSHAISYLSPFIPEKRVRLRDIFKLMVFLDIHWNVTRQKVSKFFLICEPISAV